MPLNFPTNPSLNDTYTFNNKTWVWNGEAWALQNQGAINGLIIGNVTPATGTFTTLTSTGNLSVTGTASVTGNATVGNLSVGQIDATDNITTPNTITAGVFNTDQAGNILVTIDGLTGEVAASSVSTTGNVTATGNIRGGNILSNSSVIVSGNVQANNISLDGTITCSVVDALGNITGGNILSDAVVSATGNITGGNVVSNAAVYDSKSEIRTVPVNTQITNYTLAITDAGKFISTNANVTVPNGVFSAGESISIYNNSSGNVGIFQDSGVTMFNVGTSSTGNRTLAQRGLATVFCVDANTFVVTGGGVS